MHCLICQEPTSYFLSKTYTEQPFAAHMEDIGTVDYFKCSNCGFTFSKTHASLSPERWAKLNLDVHAFMEDPAAEKKGNQPPYLEQAAMIKILIEHGLINGTNMLDYAAGHGTLSRVLEKYFQLHLPIFDEYVTDGDVKRYILKENLGLYNTVINSAMFEHVLTREDLDKVNQLVTDDGALILHTVICENVPADPEWFYFRPPVHTAFHTNKSMSILMQQWGYASSLYCPTAKCWILLKKDTDSIAASVAQINLELQKEYLMYTKGFVDYWKGF
ncbi:MAG: class I SAM-dependent methyltransferase [Bacteroidetes bacterium]|nr:class I SAM-dependent methyltransferase [Bacteroidota bacterium]